MTGALYESGVLLMERRSLVVDIHEFEKQYAQAEARVRASAISDRNKQLILRYRDACLLRQVCGQVRLIRVFIILVQVGLVLKKDFDQTTREDVERVLASLLARRLTPNTISTYKAILKRFLTWVFHPDEFPKTLSPPCVAWMTSHVRRQDIRRLQRTDLLTPEDIDRLIAVSPANRDRAIIGVLWETGCRVSEVGNLQIKHVVKQQHGFTLDLTGKTGRRSPLVISSAPYLAAWLDNHPFKDNPDNPLWVQKTHRNTPTPMRYASISALLRRTFQRAGIKKPFHPHIFRHSRATFLLANGLMNEQQVKMYCGWTNDSNMLATYSHLVDQDANNAILRENNLTPVQQKNQELQPVLCRICNVVNPPRSEYCTRCSAVLDLRRAYEHQALHDMKEELFVNMFRLLVQKGMIDDAAKEIHDAGLGLTLKRLAQHLSGEAPLHPALATTIPSSAVTPSNSPTVPPGPALPVPSNAVAAVPPEILVTVAPNAPAPP